MWGNGSVDQQDTVMCVFLCRLSPEIFLKRPVVEGNRWRLDNVLRRKAVSRKLFLLSSLLISDHSD